MKRKTNLFYSGNSQDSNYLSFSNYTESLTGNYLSTDTKIYPSSFLCLYVPKLDIPVANPDREYYKSVEQLNEDVVKAISGEPVPFPSEFYDLNNDGKLDMSDLDSIPLYDLSVLNNKIYSYLCSQNDQARFDAKEEFITYCLISRYENKMAFLRDEKTKSTATEDSLPEESILPLNYLLEYLYEYDPNTEINYVGNITEQDYNGTFADTICVIEPSKYKRGELVLNSDYSKEIELYTSSTSYLYGWSNKGTNYDPEFDFNRDGMITVSYTPENSSYWKQQIDDPNIVELANTYNMTPTPGKMDDLNTYIALYSTANIVEDTHEVGPNNSTIMPTPQDFANGCSHIIELAAYTDIYHGPQKYKEVSPIFDGFDDISHRNYYETTSHIQSIKLINEMEVSHDPSSTKEIKFNIVIPMYDVIDINYKSDTKVINEMDEIPLTNNTIDPHLYIEYVPMGIWFSGMKPVVLNRDCNTGYCQTWSLALSSQFKPFPYSHYMPDEITETSKLDAFMTFAQILTRQNEMMDSLTLMMDQIADISNRLNIVESNLGSSGTSNNLDGMKQEIVNMNNYLNNQLTEIRNEIAERELKWINREG